MCFCGLISYLPKTCGEVHVLYCCVYFLFAEIISQIACGPSIDHMWIFVTANIFYCWILEGVIFKPHHLIFLVTSVYDIGPGSESCPAVWIKLCRFIWNVLCVFYNTELIVFYDLAERTCYLSTNNFPFDKRKIPLIFIFIPAVKSISKDLFNSWIFNFNHIQSSNIAKFF